jgi:NAD(P)-dependent dehydrogenase (short-subunit alcohol dehydrogenase family)
MNESTGRETRVALITGANKGIGYEIARGLCKQDFEVLIGCRDQYRLVAFSGSWG